MHAEFEPLGLPRSGRFMVGETKARQVSMKLIASLAPARAEIEAGVVAKTDQNQILGYNLVEVEPLNTRISITFKKV